MTDLKLTLSSGEETFTRNELRDAIQDLTTWNYALKNRVFSYGHLQSGDETDAIVRKITENRQKTVKDDDEEEFTFTETELRAACKRLGWNGSVIVNNIAAYREPDYPVDTVITDADGKWWQRYPNNKWAPFGDYVLREHDVPKRPLTIKS